MNEKSKKDSDMAMRVFLGFMGELNKHLVYVYSDRADEPFKDTTEYVNIEKAWHSNEEIPATDDACIINTSGENFEIGRFAYNTWETDFTFYTQGRNRTMGIHRRLVAIEIIDKGGDSWNAGHTVDNCICEVWQERWFDSIWPHISTNQIKLRKMKMNNETIDFIDLFYTYEKFGYVDRKEKVLAQLRFWLRYVLYRYYGPSRKDEMEEVFKWIWSAPVNEWNAMVVCVTRSNCQTLGEIKKLYEFLK